MRMADIREELAELDFTDQIRVPQAVKRDEPIVESACEVCRTPIKRLAKCCATCRVVA